MESNIEQEESDSSRQSADLRIRKTQVEKCLFCSNKCFISVLYVYTFLIVFMHLSKILTELIKKF